jgi:hypothetical protein
VTKGETSHKGRAVTLGLRDGDGRTADPSAPPDFLSRVAASVNCMWFSLRRTTYVVAGESGEVGNPGTLGMTNRKGWRVRGERLRNRNIFITIGGPQAHPTTRDDKGESGGSGESGY